jgi:hypothetical protein
MLPHGPVEDPSGLFCWFQIIALDTVLLKWSVWTTRILHTCFEKDMNLPNFHKLNHILW